MKGVNPWDHSSFLVMELGRFDAGPVNRLYLENEQTISAVKGRVGRLSLSERRSSG